jgi:hypothetical protein
MTEWSGYPGLSPRQVPGYARAAAAELLPRVPAQPPARLPGATARQVMMAGLAQAAVAFAVSIVVFLQIPKLGLPAILEPLIMIPVGIAPFAFFMGRVFPRAGDRSLQEMAQGYTTLTLGFGDFWLGPPRRWPKYGHRMPWDYRGLWVYDGQGQRIISAPDLSVDPPGYYPSPNRTDSLELWTGTVWAGHFRRS